MDNEERHLLYILSSLAEQERKGIVNLEELPRGALEAWVRLLIQERAELKEALREAYEHNRRMNGVLTNLNQEDQRERKCKSCGEKLERGLFTCRICGYNPRSTNGINHRPDKRPGPKQEIPHVDSYTPAE